MNALTTMTMMMVIVILHASPVCAAASPSMSRNKLESNQTVIVFGPKVIRSDGKEDGTEKAEPNGGDTTQVHILNSLGGGKALSIHCKSKDDDLEPQMVPDGAELVWGFNPNIWGTTLFYCYLNPTFDFAFDAYDFQRDWLRCARQCHWLVAAEGMYALNEGTNLWEYMYTWSA